MRQEGTYIDGDEQLPTFIPAPVPPVEPEYEYDGEGPGPRWKYLHEHHRNLERAHQYYKDEDRYRAQMEYYNSVIVPLGNSH